MKDLLILGNGMAGMTAALYAKRAGLDFKLIGKDEYDFGQIGSAVLVENYPGAKPMPGYTLASGLYDQLLLNNIQVEEREVEQVVGYEDGNTGQQRWMICYKDGFPSDEAKAIIYALGARHRKLPCEVADSEVMIHYCAVCDGPLYKDKTVAIIGGGDVAFTQAEYLSKICRLVYIVMCDQNITASPSTVERVNKLENVVIIQDYPVDKIYPYANGKNGLYCKSKNVDPYSLSVVQADGIFVAIGMIPNTEPLDTWRFTQVLDNNRYIKTDEMGRVDRLDTRGFFAAGDVRQKELRQALTAAADGANAVQAAIQYLRGLE